MNKFELIFLSVALLGLVGCSSTIHERFSVDEHPATSLSLDAKQRLFVVTDKGGKDANRRVMCAEPSPDALVGIAASGTLQASMATEGNAKLAASMAEAISELGSRTPTIQLVRDGLYRACEAYANGIIGNGEYQTLLAGYDDLVVTLLAIEGLTQRPRFLLTAAKAETEAKIAKDDGTDTKAKLELPAKAEISITPVSNEVAEAVKSILKEYYALQKYLYGKK